MEVASIERIKWSNRVSVERYRILRTELAERVKYCTKIKHVGEAKRAHDEILQGELKDDRYLANLLIEMYGKCESMEDALMVFQSIRQPNMFSWSIMISALAQNGHLQEAKKLFDEMPQKTVVACNIMTAAYSQNGNFDQAKKVFDENGRDIVSWNAMLNACLQHRLLSEAEFFFQSMPYWDIISWTTMIVEYGAKGQLEKAISMFDRMAQRNLVAWNAILGAYANNNGSYQDVERVFDKMPEKNVVSWTTMLTAYAQNGCMQQAKYMFDKMPEHNIISWTAMAVAYAQHGHLNEVKCMFDEMYPHQDVVLWTAMITVYARYGHLEQARCMFDQMPHRNLISWNAMAGAYALNGQHEKVLATFFVMQIEGWQVDETMFFAILTACSHLGFVSRCRNFLLSMKIDYGLGLRLEHYTCMVDSLGRSGQLSRAEALIYNMPFLPDTSTWLTLLAACKIHNNYEIAKRIAKLVFHLDPEKSSPYVLLCSIQQTNTMCKNN